MTFCRAHLPIVLLAAATLWGCAASSRFTDRNGSRARPETAGTGQSGSASSGDRILLSLEGVASYYADDFNGKKTSNGETYDMHAFTAAHRTFPFGTRVRVTNLANNKSVVVRINDRGPFKEGRIIDLSLGAARALEVIATGTTRVRLDVLEWGNGQ